MKALWDKIKSAFGVIHLMAQVEPWFIVLMIPQAILSAMPPVLMVYLSKNVLDALTNSLEFASIVRIVLLFVGALLAIQLLSTAFQKWIEWLNEKFAKKFRQRIGNIVMSLKLEYSENASARTAIALAANATQITEIQTLVQGILAQVLTIATLVAIIVRLDFLFILLVAATLLIKIGFTASNNRFYMKRRTRRAEIDRMEMYLYKVRTNEGGAKELRVNSLQSWFIEKIRFFRQKMLDIQFEFFRRTAYFGSVTAVIMALQSLCILWILVLRYTQNIITIGEFSLYFGAVAALMASLSAITEQLGTYAELMINVDDYHHLQTLAEQDPATQSSAASYSIPQRTEIAFHNVSFRYPGAEQDALSDISITLHDGEKLVLVGYNGAGKSTFVKLICKFYRPTSGTITLNGKDIWKIDNRDYYRLVAAVFQDFANFAFTVRENIALSEDGDNERIIRSTQKAGVADHIESLPQGYETYMSRSFDENGVEFSGGERQKLAIARALYKEAPILILDEPTASLDPRAESEIYERFFQMAAQQTTVFVSHRLAASTMADKIAVFQEGQVVEYGGHDALIRQQGLYAEMYRVQSQAYQT